MNLNNVSLPYPVLGINDDVLPLLPSDCISFDVKENSKDYLFTISLNFDNDDIKRYIRDGFAEFSCEYECPRTMLRRCIKSETSEFHIVIPRNSVNGRINFSCYVSVKNPIPDYKNQGFNPDYAGFKFSLGLGDILVAFPSAHFDADIKYEKLYAAGSFMQIRKSEKHKEVFFDLTTDKIEILLPAELYELYNNPLVKSQAEIIHSSLVTNALTYALINIDDHPETLWAKTIKYRLETEPEFKDADLDMLNIPKIVQQFLKAPYRRLFNSLILSGAPINEE